MDHYTNTLQEKLAQMELDALTGADNYAEARIVRSLIKESESKALQQIGNAVDDPDMFYQLLYEFQLTFGYNPEQR